MLLENQTIPINTQTNQNLMHFNQRFSASIEISSWFLYLKIVLDKMLNDVDFFVFSILWFSSLRVSVPEISRDSR